MKHKFCIRVSAEVRWVRVCFDSATKLTALTCLIGKKNEALAPPGSRGTGRGKSFVFVKRMTQASSTSVATNSVSSSEGQNTVQLDLHSSI